MDISDARESAIECMNAENFHRSKITRSGFEGICKTCNNAKIKAWKAARKRARVEPEHVVELPDELPGDDDDEVISD